MRKLLTDMDAGVLGPLDGVRRSEAFAHDLLAFVALMKQNLVHPAALQLAVEASASERLQVLAAVYQAYQHRMQEARLVDFRDLISGTIELLQSRPGLRDGMRAKFQLILVDEFQDVDPAQFGLLRVIAPPESRPRLVVVGDPDQSIYGFRGTVPRLLSHDFEATYGAATRHLAACRRCSQEVLDAGERLLAATQPGRSPRGLHAEGSHRRPAVVVAREGDPVDEAFFAAREIKRLRSEWPDLRLRDFAIVLRSTTALGGPFEEALRALGLPYEVRGWGATARNEVVRFLVGYLESLRRPDDPDAFESALASSLSGVGPRTVSRLRAYATHRGRPLKAVVRRQRYAAGPACGVAGRPARRDRGPGVDRGRARATPRHEATALRPRRLDHERARAGGGRHGSRVRRPRRGAGHDGSPGERPRVRGRVLLRVRPRPVPPRVAAASAARRGGPRVAGTLQGRLHAVVAGRPGRSPRGGGAAGVRGNDPRASPPLHHICRCVPAPGRAVGLPRLGRPPGRGARA